MYVKQPKWFPWSTMDVRGANTFLLRNRLPNPNLGCETDSLFSFSASRARLFSEGFIDYFPSPLR